MQLRSFHSSESHMSCTRGFKLKRCNKYWKLTVLIKLRDSIKIQYLTPTLSERFH